MPFPSLPQLSSPCVLLLITLSEKKGRRRRRGGRMRRGERKKGGGKRTYRMSSQAVSNRDTHTLTHIHIYVHAINTCADNELHSDDHMTRWRLCVIWIVYDRRQRQSAEQTPGLMRECLLCNTSQTQQHLFFYSGLSLPGSSDTEIPC